MVGGEEQLDRLTAEPLPDEPFDDQGIPDEIADRVAETLALVDRCCEELLDTEHRTAVRRLLHDVAIADPRGFDGTVQAPDRCRRVVLDGRPGQRECRLRRPDRPRN